MGLNFGDIGRWASGKEYDPQVMRQQQAALAKRAIKKIGAAEKGPAVTKGEMQDVSAVSGGLGAAGAQALVGGDLDPNAQRQLQEGAADVSAKNTAAALAGIQKYKADQLARQYSVVQVAGESAWKEAELDAQRGQGLISNALEGLWDIGKNVVG